MCVQLSRLLFVDFGNWECAVETGTLFTAGPSASFPPHLRQLRLSHRVPALVVRERAYTRGWSGYPQVSSPSPL